MKKQLMDFMMWMAINDKKPYQNYEIVVNEYMGSLGDYEVSTEYSVWERLFCRWTKWELHKSDVSYIQATYQSPILGNEKIGEDRVLVDIYVRTNKFSGLKKYKRVVKYR
jgi:hypothetical protein